MSIAKIASTSTVRGAPGGTFNYWYAPRASLHPAGRSCPFRPAHAPVCPSVGLLVCAFVCLSVYLCAYPSDRHFGVKCSLESSIDCPIECSIECSIGRFTVRSIERSVESSIECSTGRPSFLNASARRRRRTCSRSAFCCSSRTSVRCTLRPRNRTLPSASPPACPIPCWSSSLLEISLTRAFQQCAAHACRHVHTHVLCAAPKVRRPHGQPARARRQAAARAPLVPQRRLAPRHRRRRPSVGDGRLALGVLPARAGAAGGVAPECLQRAATLRAFVRARNARTRSHAESLTRDHARRYWAPCGGATRLAYSKHNETARMKQQMQVEDPTPLALAASLLDRRNIIFYG